MTLLPVWLKLEREDDEINAYYSSKQTEAVSDVNWTLLTAIALTLANPFNIGLACGNNTGTTQAQFDKVEVQAQADEGIVTVTKTIGPEGGSIGIPYDETSVGVFIPAGALFRDVEVTVKLIKDPATDYPASIYNNSALDMSDWPEKVEYTGPQVVIELPLDALDWQNWYSLEEEFKGFKHLFSAVLMHFDGSEMGKEERSEVRYWTNDGELKMDVDFVRKGIDVFYDVDILRYYHDSTPNILKISVQPVDLSKLFDDNSQNNEEINPQSYWNTSPQDMAYLETRWLVI